jgi:hypothetical protein
MSWRERLHVLLKTRITIYYIKQLPPWRKSFNSLFDFLNGKAMTSAG